MKKYLIEATSCLGLGLLSGVFYREFTKMNNFTGRTMLGFVHPHLLGLGFFFLLIIALFIKVLNMKDNRLTKIANISYLVGLGITSIMMTIRGILEVNGTSISKTNSTMISSISGIGHILVAIGLITFVVAFIKEEKVKKVK